MNYRLNDAKVYADYADGQYVILNIVTGAYYSLDRNASAVLRALLEGEASVEAVYGAMISKYGDAEETTAKLKAFLEELEKLEIILAQDKGGEGDLSALADLPESSMPELSCEVFNDVADLLLMDPIHEVDENMGWPVQKPE